MVVGEHRIQTKADKLKKDWFIRHVLKFITSIDLVTRDHTRYNVNPLPPGVLHRIILHLAPIKADRVDCSTLCRCSEMPWIFAAARGYCQVGAVQASVLCTVHYTPAHWEKFYYLSLHLISGLSPLIWDQGLTGTGVTPSANQRPVFAPLTNERPAWLMTALTPGVWLWLLGRVAATELAWCRHYRGSGFTAWPGCTGSSEFVLVSSAQLKMRIRGLNRFSSHPASTLPLNNPAREKSIKKPCEKNSVSGWIDPHSWQSLWISVFKCFQFNETGFRTSIDCWISQ